MLQKHPLAETDYAWLAGLIDGDGCFTLRNKGAGGPVLEITMTHKPTIEYLLIRFGGCVGSPTKPRPNARQYWKWYVNTDWLRTHLPSIIPFLVTKKPRGELIYRVTNIRKGRGYHLTEGEQKELQGIWIELQALNKRGLA